MSERRSETERGGAPRQGSAGMMGAVLENFIGGYLHPRASVRRLLAGKHGFEAAIGMVVLAFLVHEIFFILVPGGRPDGVSVTFIDYILGLVGSLMSFGIYTVAVYYLGRLFGGRGTLEQTALVISWFLLVTSPLYAMAAPSMMRFLEAVQVAAETPSSPPAVPGDAMAIVLGSSVLMLWLLASYVAELHRFQRTWNVLATIFGFMILFSFVFSGMMPTA